MAESLFGSRLSIGAPFSAKKAQEDRIMDLSGKLPTLPQESLSLKPHAFKERQ